MRLFDRFCDDPEVSALKDIGGDIGYILMRRDLSTKDEDGTEPNPEALVIEQLDQEPAATPKQQN
jgi:hypothetical protein